MSYQPSQRSRRNIAFALAAASMLGSALSSFASQWNYTGADNGLWNTVANWTLNGGGTHQVPANGDDAVLGLATTVSNVTFNSSYTGAGLNSLTLDSPGHAFISLNQTGVSAMIATSEYIGTTVSQNFYNQSAGTNTTTTLYLGFNTGGIGNYNLSSVGTLTASTEFIGFAGTGGGVFAQSGGTNNVSSSLVIGQTGTNLGNAYNLTGGTINLASSAGLYVGNAARGAFNQSAGTVNLSGPASIISIGTAASSTGNLYSLSGTGTVNGAGRISVGLSGSGTFTQTGGAVSLNPGGIFAIGDNAGSTGIYNLSATTGAGTLAADNFIVGGGGSGTFSQSGGTLTTLSYNAGFNSGVTAVINQTGGSVNVNGSGVISIGNAPGSSANYTIDSSAGASALNATSLRLGDGGNGTFTQNGGNVTINAVLTVGRLAGSTGIYNLNAGTLTAGVNPFAANVFVGASGTGTMNQTGGTFTIGGGATASLSLGSVNGSGTYNLSGGALTTQFLQPGNGGTGTFNQTGGTVNATQLNLSTLGGSNGTYILSGAGNVTLGVSNFEAIGVSAPGTFTQNGGVHTLGGDIQLGQNANGTGTYNLNAGTFAVAGNIGDGQAGSGFFQQSGGLLNLSNGFYIGSGSGSTGTYSINNGAAFIGTIYDGNSGPGNIFHNGGTVNVGSLFIGTQFTTAAATGTYTQSAGTLNISGTGYLGIGGATATYTLSGSGVLNAPNSPNTFNDFFIGSTGTFTQSGGTVNGYVFDSGNFNFNGGTFNGTLEVGANGVATFNSFVYFGAGLKNHGTLNIPGGQVGTAANQTLNNDGTITLSASGQIYSNGPVVNNGLITGTGSIGGTSTFTNNLTILQGAGPLTFTFGVGSATNVGTIALASGRALNLYGGITNVGDFELNGASIIQNGTLANALGGTVSGPGTILAGFSSAGTVLPGAGTLNISTAWTNAGVVELSGLTSALTGGAITNNGTIQGLGSVGSSVNNNAGTIESIGGTLVIGGALTNPANGTLTAGTGSKILVSAAFSTNAGLINLTGGTFDNGGHTLNNTGQISGFGIFRSGGLTNNGAITFSGTNGSTTTVNGSVTNSANQTLNIKYNPAIFTGAIVNNGLIKTTSTTATFTSTFTNNGSYISDPSINIFSSLNNAGLMSGGPGDVFTLSPGGNLNNSGTFTSSGTLNANGNITNSGNFTQTGPQMWSAASGFTNTAGTATFSSNAKLAALSITGGTVDITTSKFIIEPIANKSATLAALQSNVAAHSLIASGMPANFGLALLDNALLNKSTFGNNPADANSLLLSPELLGDSNADGHVDLSDLSTVLNSFGTTTGAWTSGNFDGAAAIDLTDLSDVLNNFGLSDINPNFGQASPAIATPEPATLTLFAAGSILVLSATRRSDGKIRR